MSKDQSDFVKAYVDKLDLIAKEKEEVECVILGYIEATKELEAENERLREALTDIASLDFGCDRTVEAVIASRALQTSDKDKALRVEEGK